MDADADLQRFAEIRRERGVHPEKPLADRDRAAHRVAAPPAHVAGRSIERHQAVAIERRIITAGFAQRFGELREEAVEKEEDIVGHSLLAEPARDQDEKRLADHRAGLRPDAGDDDVIGRIGSPLTIRSARTVLAWP